jgi:hypothetical protein
VNTIRSRESRAKPRLCTPHALASAAAARSASTTRPAHPLASPASTPSELDDRCRRTSLPNGSLHQLELLSASQVL